MDSPPKTAMGFTPAPKKKHYKILSTKEADWVWGVSQYLNKETAVIFQLLKTSPAGLTDIEAEKRHQIYGLNETKVRQTSLWDVFLRQFKSPFFYLLFAAALVSLLIGEEIDSLVILAFVFINVALGFFQEARAVKTAALLKQYLPSKARVLRNNKEKSILQKFLVPGDIVLLESGNIVPADLRILKAKNFLVDEEILTGESVPIPKTEEPQKTKPSARTELKAGFPPRNEVSSVGEIFEAKNIVFGGTTVVSGKASGIVLAIGKQTIFGEIAKLTAETPKKSAYEKSLLTFSKLILRMVIVSIVAVFLANLLVNKTANLAQFLIFCLALVVSIIPEALPVVATFAFSQGALKLAKNKMVVKRLSSVEDLGDIEILCADKTGTLTENRLKLAEVCSSAKEKCFLYSLLCSSFIKEKVESAQNPFDEAIFEKAPASVRENIKQFRQLAEIPFDNVRFRNSALLEQENSREKILIVRGAPEFILDISTKFEGQISQRSIEEAIKKEGSQGKRILAVAYKEFSGTDYSAQDEKDLTFLGYFSYFDPIKETVRPTVELAKKLGVQIKILTGDAAQVAGYVAKKIGLIKDIGNIILGKDLDSLPEDDFEKACQDYAVFARVSPQTKFRIIQALQKKYEVGYLGEGINDAPALKIANVAMAVREGADISREVSDIILLEKDLRVIVNGIKEGRNIFSNVNKYIKCTLASNFGNFYSIAAISLFIPFLPMLPVQILLVNLLSDFPLIAVATDKVDVQELKKPKLYQLSHSIWLIISLAGVSTIFDFIFFGIFHKAGADQLQTLWFVESILTEIALIFAVRSRHLFFKAKKPSLALIGLSFFAALVTIWLPFSSWGREFFHFTMPPITSLLIVGLLIVSYFVTSEIVKLTYFWRWRVKNRG